MEGIEFPFYLKGKTQANIFRCQLRSGFLYTGSPSSAVWRVVLGLGGWGQMLTSGFSEGSAFPHSTSSRRNFQEIGANRNRLLWPLDFIPLADHPGGWHSARVAKLRLGAASGSHSAAAA